AKLAGQVARLSAWAVNAGHRVGAEVGSGMSGDSWVRAAGLASTLLALTVTPGFALRGSQAHSSRSRCPREGTPAARRPGGGQCGGRVLRDWLGWMNTELVEARLAPPGGPG